MKTKRRARRALGPPKNSMYGGKACKGETFSLQVSSEEERAFTLEVDDHLVCQSRGHGYEHHMSYPILDDGARISVQSTARAPNDEVTKRSSVNTHVSNTLRNKRI